MNKILWSGKQLDATLTISHDTENPLYLFFRMYSMDGTGVEGTFQITSKTKTVSQLIDSLIEDIKSDYIKNVMEEKRGYPLQ